MVQYQLQQDVQINYRNDVELSFRGRGWFAIRFRHSSNITLLSGLPPKQIISIFDKVTTATKSYPIYEIHSKIFND